MSTSLLPLSETSPLPAIQSETSQVMDLFRRAFEAGGATPEALAQLVALREQIERRNAELEFASAMVEFQTTCPPIPKTSSAEIATASGGRFGYKFADFEQIIETVRPHLQRLGLSVTFDSSSDGKMLTCTAILRHVNGHSIQSSFTLPTDTRSAMSAQQAVGAALTFAKRQCLVSVLGLSLTDPDAEGGAGLEPISDGQCADLGALLEEVKADRPRFLKHFGIASLSGLRQNRYAEAARMLEAKRKAAR